MVTLRFLGAAGLAAALAALGSVTACTTDDGDPGAATGGSGSGGSGGGSHTGGSPAGGAGTGGSATGTVCASSVLLDAAKSGVADFDAYDGKALATWTFPLGGDSSVGVLGGPFGYGDRPDGFPETFEMGTGHDSMYALRIADTLASGYGGGMGTWLSGCINASKFSGVSFWVRGNAPEGKAKFTASMQETLPITPAMAGGAVGTCAGDAKTCIHPTFVFPVTDEWTEIKAPWTGFTPGNAAGALVKPDGKNLTQLQFDIGLVWVADAAGTYMPTPAPYELVVDSLSFY